MPLKIRTRKNKDRGTELTYATIPTNEFGKMSLEEINRLLETHYKQKAGGKYHPFIDKNISAITLYDRNGKETNIHLGDYESFNSYFARNKDYVAADISPLRGVENGEKIYFKKIGKSILILDEPISEHAVRGVTRGSQDPWGDLQSILANGFQRGKNMVYVKNKGGELEEADDAQNIFSSAFFEVGRKPGLFSTPSKRKDITEGDSYTIFGFPKDKHPRWSIMYGLNQNDILTIGIGIPENISDKEKQEKIKFYEQKIFEKYKIPLRFYECSEGRTCEMKTKRILPKRNQNLEGKVTSVIAIAGLGAGIFFLSNNITGNAIADLSTNTTSWVGGVLLVIGLVAGFFWIKSKKKNPIVKKKSKK